MLQHRRILRYEFLLLVTCPFFGCSPPPDLGRSIANATKTSVRSETVSTTAKMTEGLRAEPLQVRRRLNGGPLYEQLGSEQTGVDYQLDVPNITEYPKELLFLNPLGGICTGDFDADGLVDFFVSSPTGDHGLYRNLGGFRFQDVALAVGINREKFWGSGATFVDIDNDGDLDLYVCAYDDRNRLFVNQGADADGNVRFEEQAGRFNLAYNGASMTMAFADIDNDGDLDGYLATTAKSPPPGTKFRVVFEGDVPKVPAALKEYWQLVYLPGERATVTEAGQYDYLFRNDNGRFVDISADAGIQGPYFTLSATWWDYNGDSLPDLYVSNDFSGPDMLYRNDGNGKFTDVIKQVMPHTPWFSMGSDLGDVNNDGLIDFLASDMSATTHYREKVMMGNMDDLWLLDVAEPRQYMRNALYLNSGAGPMMEAAYMTGLASTDWTWNPRFGDFDNDGRLDLFVTNGILRDMMNSDLSSASEQKFDKGSPEWAAYWANQPMRNEKNFAFHNLGDLKFAPMQSEWGLDRDGVSFGAATADFDSDGDLDLVVNNADEPLSLYRNRSSAGNSITVRLVGTKSNRFGLGATVQIKANGTQQVRYVTMSRGWLSSNDPALHFGLGEAKQIDQLTITWPSGRRQSFENLDANQQYSITEAEASKSEPLPAIQRTHPLFAQMNGGPKFVHHENDFDEFAKQPLLPNRLSMAGPAMAVGDVDGDDDLDLYFGASTGQAAGLFINARGIFTAKQVDVFDAHKVHEDTCATFMDADGDGDQDLFVVSGGVEKNPGDEYYRDRLYINDGSGNFVSGEGVLPDIRESGSTVAAADVDHDGDLDLFVGSRCVPGEYPVAAPHQLLINEAGTFVNRPPEPLANCGMVTDATWSDLNGDGWEDLVVATDWGPIKVFINLHGQLTDATQSAGLETLRGWWTSVTIADVDADGDYDLIAGNFGLNTKYKATTKKPEILYYGDFDGSGKAHIVEAKYEGAVCLPRRGFSCSRNAMPFLNERFQTFHNFARASLPQLYGESKLDAALQLKATTLQSGVFINDGNARFAFRPLPRLAQIAPSMDLIARDFNVDGIVDIFILHNFYGPQRETGRMDGGLSLLLLGDGTGDFAPVWPDESGIVLPVDSRRTAAADLNGDSRPDLIIAVNNGPVNTLRNEASASQDSAGQPR